MNKTLNLALYAWQNNIVDPAKGDSSPDAERCRKFILEECIWQGLDWQGWIKTYPGNGSFAWCGAFAAYCMPHVKPELRKKWWASTYRLSEYGKKDKRRQVKTSDILPGDIVVVGDGDYGSHITLAVAWDKAKSQLLVVSGNGRGRLANGEWGEGVVLNMVDRQTIKAAYRPTEDDTWTG